VVSIDRFLHAEPVSRRPPPHVNLLSQKMGIHDAKAILRMGVPVSPRSIFPSNIQGLPTWYAVRVSEAGWLGRHGGVDLMVAINPQTWVQDVADVEPGSHLFYDSARATAAGPIPRSDRHRDLQRHLRLAVQEHHGVGRLVAADGD
jgi:Pyruvate/2-oxoacid:ferredoxin oxidoreductase gamma subunit